MNDAVKNRVKEALIRQLLSKRSEWSKLSRDRAFNGATFIREFVEDSFNQVLDMNIEDFVAKCYSGNKDAKGIEIDANGARTPTPELRTAAQEIARKLYSDGEVLASVRNIHRFDSFPKDYYLVMPESTSIINPLILAEIQSLAAANGGGANVKVFTSKKSNSFTFFTNHLALPAEAFTWILSGERAYASSGEDQITQVGRHISEANQHWVSLPNLTTPELWNSMENGYTFADEQRYLRIVDKLMETARSYGLIALNNNEYYVSVLNDAGNRLGNANEVFGGSNAQDERTCNAEQIYREEARRLFDTLNKENAFDISNIKAALSAEEFDIKRTRPHHMQMDAGPGGTDDTNWRWNYTKKFMRKMYNTCLSLQRTIGVFKHLIELVQENNARIEENSRRALIRQEFPRYFGCEMIKYSVEESAWVYKNEMGNYNELYSDIDLQPWQRAYQHYFLLERLYALPKEALQDWDRQCQEHLSNTANRGSFMQKQQELLSELQVVANAIRTTQFVTNINAAQKDAELPERMRQFYREMIVLCGGN
jgi:hypothetical protein